MNSNSSKKQSFIFIFNRYKLSENGAKRSNQVTPNTNDFEVNFTDYTDLKNQLKDKVDQLIGKLKDNHSFHKNSVFRSLAPSLANLVDYDTTEKFIISLINMAGVCLKGFAKVIFDNHEYLFKNKSIIKYNFNEHVFFHKDEEPFEKIWSRREFEPRFAKWHNHRDNEKKITSELSRKIETFDDFYKTFKSYKLKPK